MEKAVNINYNNFNICMVAHSCLVFKKSVIDQILCTCWVKERGSNISTHKTNSVGIRHVSKDFFSKISKTLLYNSRYNFLKDSSYVHLSTVKCDYGGMNRNVKEIIELCGLAFNWPR